MNLTITKDQILAGLQAVQNVVSTRTTLPILSNVLLRAEGNTVEFTATKSAPVVEDLVPSVTDWPPSPAPSPPETSGAARYPPVDDPVG